MLKIKLILAITVLPVLLFAQAGSLTILSDDGYKFLLFLNGTQQNNVSQTNLRVDGLTSPLYNARIVFEDRGKHSIEQDITVMDVATSAPQDVTYKIKNNDGVMKLLVFSTQSSQPNYTPPANVSVVHYTQPEKIAAPPADPGASDPSSGGGSVSFSMGFGAAPAPPTPAAATNDNANKPPAPLCQYPMDKNSFKTAKDAIANEAYDDSKLSLAQTMLTTNCVSTEQVILVCKLFGFEKNKLLFARYAYPKTTDPGNYSKVVNTFTFDASKNELNTFINNGGR